MDLTLEQVEELYKGGIITICRNGKILEHRRIENGNKDRIMEERI